jgi:hypothetical protein
MMMERESVEKIVQAKKDQAFAATIVEITQAIDMCIEAKMFLAGQMLMYAGIDIMANFDRPEEKVEGTQQDFKNWAKKYILDPNPHLNVNADDLYGGRCGLIHAAIIESGKSRSGAARLIFPVLKPASMERMQEALDDLRRDAPEFHGVAVYLDELLAAFVEGLERFRKDVEGSVQKTKIVMGRAGKVPVFWKKQFLFGDN